MHCIQAASTSELWEAAEQCVRFLKILLFSNRNPVPLTEDFFSCPGNKPVLQLPQIQ